MQNTSHRRELDGVCGRRDIRYWCYLACWPATVPPGSCDGSCVASGSGLRLGARPQHRADGRRDIRYWCYLACWPATVPPGSCDGSCVASGSGRSGRAGGGQSSRAGARVGRHEPFRPSPPGARAAAIVEAESWFLKRRSGRAGGGQSSRAGARVGRHEPFRPSPPGARAAVRALVLSAGRVPAYRGGAAPLIAANLDLATDVGLYLAAQVTLHLQVRALVLSAGRVPAYRGGAAPLIAANLDLATDVGAMLAPETSSRRALPVPMPRCEPRLHRCPARARRPMAV